MSKKNRLIFFGNERLAAGLEPEPMLLPALIADGYEIAALVLSQEQTVSSRRNRQPKIIDLANRHKIPILTPVKPAEIKQKLTELNAQAGILAAYGKLIPKEMLKVFPAGVINLHPSLLPKLRGPSPVESAILEGTTKTGVSIIKLVPQMDAGPIYGQSKVQISQTEGKTQLATKLAQAGTKLLIELLPDIIAGKLEPALQQDNQATYTKLIAKKDGEIDWLLPVRQVERQIRAFQGWPGSYTKIWGKDVIITQAHAVPSSGPDDFPGKVEPLADTGVLMVYAQGGYICIDKLKPAGKSEMSAAEFMRGYKP